MRGRIPLLIHLVAIALSLPQCLLFADTPRSPEGFTLEGTVTYHPDPARPWKLSRYYIQDRKQGLLAEAVIALTGPTLRKTSPARTVVMDQVAFQFVPETIAINAGDSVKFTNSDEAMHNVMTRDGGSPFNVHMGRNGTHTHQFKEAGGIARPVRIGCVYHGGMRAWIHVFDHPWHTVTSKPGSFRLTGVPPGDYVLRLSHPAGRLEWEQPVTISTNTTLKINLSPDNIRPTKQ